MSLDEAFNKVFRPDLRDLSQQTEEQNQRLREHRAMSVWKYNKFNKLPLMASRVEK